jgi:hypothetical protein
VCVCVCVCVCVRVCVWIVCVNCELLESAHLLGQFSGNERFRDTYVAALDFGTLPWHPMVQLLAVVVRTSSNIAMHSFGTTAKDGNRSYLARQYFSYCWTFSLAFLSDYIIHVNPMIRGTILCSGQGKTHDECAALVRGLQHMLLLGCMGIECDLRILKLCGMSPICTRVSVLTAKCIVPSPFTTTRSLL